MDGHLTREIVAVDRVQPSLFELAFDERRECLVQETRHVGRTGHRACLSKPLGVDGCRDLGPRHDFYPAGYLTIYPDSSRPHHEPGAGVSNPAIRHPGMTSHQPTVTYRQNDPPRPGDDGLPNADEIAPRVSHPARMFVVMDIRDELHELVDDVVGDDPRRALMAYRRLSGDELGWLEQRVVALARRNEWSWGRIARILGRSRQSVHRRFASLGSQLPRRVPRVSFDILGNERERERMWAEQRRQREYERQLETVDANDLVPW